MHWVSFFSQTGSEIVEIATTLNRWPDTICTNKSIKEISDINPVLLEKCFNKIYFLKDRPTIEEYSTVLRPARAQSNIVTLNGYLRIIPKQICEHNIIYNGHPGDITIHPELKGYNPQEKAFKLKIKKTGSVIHVVTPEIDDGTVVAVKKCNIDLKSLDNTYKILHKNSISLWVEFLSEYLNIRK